MNRLFSPPSNIKNNNIRKKTPAALIIKFENRVNIFLQNVMSV